MRHYGTSSGARIRQAASLSYSLNSFFRAGSLEKFLQEESGVDEDAILAYLPDGRRLRNENVRDLAGAEDQVRHCQHAVPLTL